MELLITKEKFGDILVDPSALDHYFNLSVHPEAHTIFVGLNQGLAASPIPGVVKYVPFGSSVAKWAIRKSLGISPQMKDLELGYIFDTSRIENLKPPTIQQMLLRHSLELKHHHVYPVENSRLYLDAMLGCYFDLNQQTATRRLIEDFELQSSEFLYPNAIDLIGFALPFIQDDPGIENQAFDIIDRSVYDLRSGSPDTRVSIEHVLEVAFASLLNAEKKHVLPAGATPETNPRYLEFLEELNSHIPEVAAVKARQILARF